MDYNEERIILNNLSQNVNEIMTKQDISIHELSKRSGLSEHVIRNIKDGTVKKLNRRNVYNIATGLQVSLHNLLGVKKIPSELTIREEHTEFILSFYEKDGRDYQYDEKCGLFDKYDDEYEACVVNCIHSFVEAHKLATGYYFEGIDRSVTSQLTRKEIHDKFFDYVVEKSFNELEEIECIDDKPTWEFDKVKNTGETIQKMRRLYKMSRKELADKTGLSKDCLRRIESGKNQKVNYQHINLIARELFCTADFLLGDSCDPTASRDGQSQLFSRNEFIFRYVQIGHDLAYAKNYMDQESKEVLKKMIGSLNVMYDYREANELLKGKRLSLQDVFFREQQIYMDTHKKRGAHFYTKKYYMDSGEETDNEHKG